SCPFCVLLTWCCLLSRNRRVVPIRRRESRPLRQSIRLIPWRCGSAEDHIRVGRRRQHRSQERFPCRLYTWSREPLFGRWRPGLGSRLLEEGSYHHWHDRLLHLRPPLLLVPSLLGPSLLQIAV